MSGDGSLADPCLITNCTDLNGNYKNTKINLQEDKKWTQ